MSYAASAALTGPSPRVTFSGGMAPLCPSGLLAVGGAVPGSRSDGADGADRARRAGRSDGADRADGRDGSGRGGDGSGGGGDRGADRNVGPPGTARAAGGTVAGALVAVVRWAAGCRGKCIAENAREHRGGGWRRGRPDRGRRLRRRRHRGGRVSSGRSGGRHRCRCRCRSGGRRRCRGGRGSRCRRRGGVGIRREGPVAGGRGRRLLRGCRVADDRRVRDGQGSVDDDARELSGRGGGHGLRHGGCDDARLGHVEVRARPGRRPVPGEPRGEEVRPACRRSAGARGGAASRLRLHRQVLPPPSAPKPPSWFPPFWPTTPSGQGYRQSEPIT